MKTVKKVWHEPGMCMLRGYNICMGYILKFRCDI
jgi:hypothetical protein